MEPRVTDLDELLEATGGFTPTPAAAETVIEQKRRPCIHPRDRRVGLEGGGYRCDRCQRVITVEQVRRGRRSRRLGGDTERRIERLYGPRKVGEFGDPVDHLGKLFRWQSKATRGLPPKWLAIIDQPVVKLTLPAAIAVPWHHMEGHYEDRRRIVIRSYVRNGGKAEGRTRDWLFLAVVDSRPEFAWPDGPAELDVPGAWLVIPGDWWLDNFGRDE